MSDMLLSYGNFFLFTKNMNKGSKAAGNVVYKNTAGMLPSRRYKITLNPKCEKNTVKASLSLVVLSSDLASSGVIFLLPLSLMNKRSVYRRIY